MNRTLLTLTLAAQLAAVGAFAQTGTATTGTADSPMTFGSDWSGTLGPALMGADGTTVRPAAELVSQWATLSDDDKAMIRRDCMAYMQQSGSTGAPTTTGTGTASGTTGTAGSSMGTTSGTSSHAVIPVTVTMAQMEEICAATKGF